MLSKWLKRIRAAVGMGLTWAAVWSGFGAILGLLMAVFGVPLSVIVGVFLGYGAIGFVGGAIFSAVLALAEGRRTFDELSLPRFSVWGAVGGLLLWVLGGGLVSSGFIGAGIAALLGAGSAAGSLALARKADDGALLEAGEEVADIGLTKDEKRELLGT